MQRRHFLLSCAGLAATAYVSPLKKTHWNEGSSFADVDAYLQLPDPQSDRERQAIDLAEDMDSRDSDTMSSVTKAASANEPTVSIASASQKSIAFDQNFSDDIMVGDGQKAVLESVFQKLKNLQKTIGYGNFNLISFDEALKFADRYSAIGRFTAEELAFIDEVFHRDAKEYGFGGEKVTISLTESISKNQAFKVPGSGHYLFREQSLAYFHKLQHDVGDSIVLTSGIRANVKQLYLFLAKTIRVDGNLSKASRSLAPPGYSYHGIGDFDVGRIGWGEKNFTDDFAHTDEYKRMQDLGYITIRYDHGNNLGVRFEPWHIKVV